MDDELSRNIADFVTSLLSLKTLTHKVIPATDETTEESKTTNDFSICTADDSSRKYLDDVTQNTCTKNSGIADIPVNILFPVPDFVVKNGGITYLSEILPLSIISCNEQVSSNRDSDGTLLELSQLFKGV